MAETEEEQQFRWGLVAAVVAMFLVIVVVAGYFLWPDRSAPDGAPTENDETTDARPGEDLDVTVGAGGSELAPDDKTPIGYESTCTGAVQAATNYVRLLEWADLDAPDGTEETIDHIIIDGDLADERKTVATNETVRNTLPAEELDALPDHAYDTSFHPEWSGRYHVEECTEGDSAEIQVAGVQEDIPGPDTTRHVYMGINLSLVWTDDDWKVQSYGQDPEATTLTAPNGDTPEPEKASVTYVNWDDDEPKTVTEETERVVMDSESLAAAFEPADTDAAKWVPYQEGDSQ